MLPCNISHWFKGVYRALRLDGCSSHSGRRTFVTTAARRIVEVGDLSGMSNSLLVMLLDNKPKTISEETLKLNVKLWTLSKLVNIRR